MERNLPATFFNRRYLQYFLAGLLAIYFLITFPLAFRNRAIHIDEAWIGEQAYTLQRDGIVTNNLFADYPPLDGEIVIYHKLPVWLGGIFVKLFGWGLYPLRAISILAGFALLLVFFRALAQLYNWRVGIVGTLLLLWVPQFWEAMRIFRPEILLTLFGFASYLLARFAAEKNRLFPAALAGIAAGFAGLAHPLGMIFAAAGSLALIFHKKIIPGLILALLALLTFAPYISGFITDDELFLRQLADNGIMASKLQFSWWTPFLNLLNEHKRIFRNGDVIGISLLFLLAVATFRQVRKLPGRFYWQYLLIAFLLLAIAPFPKITRYYLPLIPFLVIGVSLTVESIISDSDTNSGLRRPIYLFCLALFIGYGFYALGRAASVDWHAPRELEASRMLAEKMTPGAVVIGRFDMVFDYIDEFRIYCWWGTEQRLSGNFHPETVEQYADSIGAHYLVITKYNLEQMNLNSQQVSARFRRFQPVLMLPERERYLFGYTVEHSIKPEP